MVVEDAGAEAALSSDRQRAEGSALVSHVSKEGPLRDRIENLQVVRWIRPWAADRTFEEQLLLYFYFNSNNIPNERSDHEHRQSAAAT
jgi:hypothetical protein